MERSTASASRPGERRQRRASPSSTRGLLFGPVHALHLSPSKTTVPARGGEGIGQGPVRQSELSM